MDKTCYLQVLVRFCISIIEALDMMRFCFLRVYTMVVFIKGFYNSFAVSICCDSGVTHFVFVHLYNLSPFFKTFDFCVIVENYGLFFLCLSPIELCPFCHLEHENTINFTLMTYTFV
jgi:hypothetical protein